MIQPEFTVNAHGRNVLKGCLAAGTMKRYAMDLVRADARALISAKLRAAIHGTMLQPGR